MSYEINNELGIGYIWHYLTSRYGKQYQMFTSYLHPDFPPHILYCQTGIYQSLFFLIINVSMLFFEFMMWWKRHQSDTLGVLQDKSLWVVVWVYLSQNQESLKSPQTSFGCLQTRFRLLALPREFIHHLFFNQPRLPSWEGCERCKLCPAALHLKWWKKTCHVQSSHWL